LSDQPYYYGTGRRKTSVARVRIMPGNGAIIIDGRSLEERFPQIEHQTLIREPFLATGSLGKFNAVVKVVGGGISGQAAAIRHGLARALVAADENYKAVLRKLGLLTRDPRVKERKKYGLKRARKAPQYTKR
jgi:small subunit ribosomal protein S9